MKAPTAARLLAFAVVALFVVSALSVAGTAAAPSVLTDNSASNGSAGISSAATTTPAATTSVTSHNVAAQMASSALAATKAAGISSHYVFPPRPSATPAEVAKSQAQGYVTPLYTGIPAPMGLGYFGTSAATNGSVTPTILNTTRVQAYVDTTGTGIASSDLFQSSPDSYGIQLNAVTTNVTLLGTGGYSFWTQNVVEFYPDSGFLVLVTNVWNFSGGPLSSNVFYAHGPYGVQVGTEYYYAEAAIAGISYPFNLTLTMTSNLTDNRNAVYFTVGMTGPTIPSFLNSLTYDYVVFNSLAGNATGPVSVSNYTANGYTYNPIGLTDDFELIFGGPGGGSQATLSSADASLGLATWNGTAYVSVPSAYTYGGETGETVTGANVAWSNGAGGPTGMSTFGTMTSGPSILTGLWNATGAEGSYPVTISGAPSNAFSIVTPVGGNPNFQVDEAAVAPGVFGTTLYLTPGSYSIETELSGYSPVINAVTVSGPTTVPATLTANPSAGIYTPLWAMSNAELAAISTSGAGTVSSPYVLISGPSASLSSAYGLYNDFTFPVFPGIFLMDTTANVEIVHEPSLTVATNTFAFPGQYLPSNNSPQAWFWNVSNVAITNTTFQGGWFGSNTYYTVSFDTFNVIFYASTNNLVYHDTFATPAQGLLMFAGSSAFGPSTGGGGFNTVWGSTFYQASAGPACPSYPLCEGLFPYFLGLGLQVAEGNDTFVNNAFANPTTAWQMPLNMYSGYPMLYANLWNVTPGHVLAPLANFPNLSFAGPNLLGGANQGGNYWWDYGYLPGNPYNGANNPIGVLPYDENATTLITAFGPAFYNASYIYPGGDYAPLSPITYAVTFQELGLPNGAPWEIYTSSPSTPLFPSDIAVLEGGSTAGTPFVVTLYLPNGTYNLGSLVSGELIKTPKSFAVSGASTSVTIVFYPASSYGYLKFHEVGLPIGSVWTVCVMVASTCDNQSSVTNWNVFVLPQGTYTFSVPSTSNGYQPKLLSGTVHLGRTTVVQERYIPWTYNVSFVESGLPAGKSWTVQVSGLVNGHSKVYTGHSKTSTIQFTLPNGTYGFVVKPIPGYTAGPNASGLLNVSGRSQVVPVGFTTATYTVTFREFGLPSGTNWSVTIGTKTVYGTTTSTSFNVTFNLADGTYHYTIGTLSGYVSSGSPRAVHVHGGPVTVRVTFRTTPTFNA